LPDVIVVGAGPAGSQTAHELSRRGRSVTVFDCCKAIGAKLCAGIIGRECAERYEISGDLIHLAARSARILPPEGPEIRVEREEVQAYVIDRVRFVAGVADRARTQGAEYRLRRRVAHVEVLPDRVVVTARHNGRTERCEARALVIASGFATGLPRMVGLEAASTPAYAAQAKIAGAGVDEVTVYARRHLPRGFFGWVVPSANGTALVGALGRARPAAALGALLNGLTADGVAFTSAAPVQQWGVPLRPAARTYGDRVVLVGDAAGQVKPTTGGGIYYSMRSGEMAAEVLDDALERGDLSARSLHAYENRWRTVFGREMLFGYVARRIYEHLSASDVDALLRAAMSNGLLQDNHSFDWHADVVIRALGYKLLQDVLGPVVERLGFRVAPQAAG